MPDETNLTPVREWIVKQLKDLLPSDTSEICSNTNGALFKEWTRMSHESLTAIWIREDTQRAINNIMEGRGDSLNLLRYKAGASVAMANAKALIEKRRQEFLAFGQPGTQPTGASSMLKPAVPTTFNPGSMIKGVGTTTSCNAFLGVVVEKILAAGGLAKRNFPSFDLPKAGGPAWNFYPTADKAMKPGDFYELGKRLKVGKSGEVLQFQHVGIIVAVNENSWDTADSGQGGPSVGFDRIKRKKLNVSDSILGWIDVDKFFENWRGPGTIQP